MARSLAIVVVSRLVDPSELVELGVRRAYTQVFGTPLEMMLIDIWLCLLSIAGVMVVRALRRHAGVAAVRLLLRNDACEAHRSAPDLQICL